MIPLRPSKVSLSSIHQSMRAHETPRDLLSSTLQRDAVNSDYTTKAQSLTKELASDESNKATTQDGEIFVRT
jgi:hypothetical protein